MTSNDQGLALHQLILYGDDLALTKLYDEYGSGLIDALKNWYQSVAKTDSALIVEAVNEAFWGYFRNPVIFDSSKGTLKRFLEVAAERDLLNILERERKHNGKENLPDDVELEEKLWNRITEGKYSTDEDIIRKEISQLVDDELAIHFKEEKDIILAKMIIQGVRDTGSFAEVLEIAGLEKDEQKREVKRNKDRIIKVIERNQIIPKLKKMLQ